MKQFYPSSARFMLGTLGLGVGLGITLTLAMTDGWFSLHVSKAHRFELLYGIAVFFMVVQVIMLRKWHKRLEREKDILDEMLVEVQPEMDALLARVRRQLNERT